MSMDHLDEAKRLMSAIDTKGWREEGIIVGRRTAAALVHATLALAEEQRNSNLLYLARHTGDGELKIAVEKMLTERITIQPPAGGSL